MEGCFLAAVGKLLYSCTSLFLHKIIAASISIVVCALVELAMGSSVSTVLEASKSSLSNNQKFSSNHSGLSCAARKVLRTAIDSNTNLCKNATSSVKTSGKRFPLRIGSVPDSTKNATRKRRGRRCQNPEGCQALAKQVIYGERDSGAEPKYCKDHRGDCDADHHCFLCI